MSVEYDIQELDIAAVFLIFLVFLDIAAVLLNFRVFFGLDLSFKLVFEFGPGSGLYFRVRPEFEPKLVGPSTILGCSVGYADSLVGQGCLQRSLQNNNFH